jgi:NitT/TauT family transport system permease protein
MTHPPRNPSAYEPKPAAPAAAPLASAPAPGRAAGAPGQSDALRPSAWRGWLGRMLIWLAILIAWEGAYRATGWRTYLYPAPSSVADALANALGFNLALARPIHRGWPRGTVNDAPVPAAHFYDPPLVEAVVVSASRLAAGFIFSIALGSALGLIMWRYRFMDGLLGPLFLGMQTLPSVCWVPLAIIFFHYSERAVVFVLIMGSFFAVAISLRDGLRTIPPLYQRAGLMLGARSWRLYRYVLLPASLPALASGLRQGFSFAWRSLMGAEFVLAVERHGVGYLLQQARDFNDDGGIVAIMIIMVVIGMLADRLAFARLERKVQQRFGLMAAR